MYLNKTKNQKKVMITDKILQKIKDLQYIEGSTITEIADQLGTTRNFIRQIIFYIKKLQDNIDEVEQIHYRKNLLLKYKEFYVFRAKKKYLIVFKNSEKFKELIGIK